MTTVTDVRGSHPELPLTRLPKFPDRRVRREYTRDLVDGGRLAFLAVSRSSVTFAAGTAVDPIVRAPLVVADHGDYPIYRLR